MTTIITARRFLTDIGSVEFAVIELSPDGNISEIYSDPKNLHADETTLTAAFFDIHTHGAMGHDVMQASPTGFSAMQRFMALHGVAHYLPTTVAASIDDTLQALQRIANAIEAPTADGEARPAGIHLEGPFLSHAKRGVHPAAHLQPPSVELFSRFQQAARGHIQLLTLAPEPNAVPHSGSALDLIRHATSQGVRVSLGHTNATAAETRGAMDAGATSATHTFNAMRPLDHREPGVLGVVLDDHRLYAELICDGVHVDPVLVRLWLKAKGLDRAILVTDSMSATGMTDGAYSLAGLPVTVANGKAVLTEAPDTLAGSILTMDKAVSNLQAFIGTPLRDAVCLASHNPAAMLGRPELTRLAPGSPANLNRFDASGNLVATYIQGKQLT